MRCRDAPGWIVWPVPVLLYPGLDVIEPEAQMPAESEMGDGVVVTTCRSPVDEGLRNIEQSRDVFDGQVSRCEEELKLLRLRRPIFRCHVPPLIGEVKQRT